MRWTVQVSAETGRFAVACQVLALHHGRPSCPSAIGVAVTVADKDGDTFAGHFWRGQTLSVIRTSSCRRHLIATSCPGVYTLPRAGPLACLSTKSDGHRPIRHLRSSPASSVSVRFTVVPRGPLSVCSIRGNAAHLVCAEDFGSLLDTRRPFLPPSYPCPPHHALPYIILPSSLHPTLAPCLHLSCTTHLHLVIICCCRCKFSVSGFPCCWTLDLSRPAGACVCKDGVYPHPVACLGFIICPTQHVLPSQANQQRAY